MLNMFELQFVIKYFLDIFAVFVVDVTALEKCPKKEDTAVFGNLL